MGRGHVDELQTVLGMSGGAFDYNDRRIGYLADEIESRIERDFRRTEPHWLTKKPEQVDELYCETPEQRAAIVAEAKKLVVDLRSVAERCKNLDYLLSGDDGAETFLKHLNDK